MIRYMKMTGNYEKLWKTIETMDTVWYGDYDQTERAPAGLCNLNYVLPEMVII